MLSVFKSAIEATRLKCTKAIGELSLVRTTEPISDSSNRSGVRTPFDLICDSFFRLSPLELPDDARPNNLLSLLPELLRPAKHGADAQPNALRPQRTVAPSFRADLAYALQPGCSLTESSFGLANAPAGLDITSDEVVIFARDLMSVANMKVEQRLRFGRYLGALGYHEQRLCFSEAAFLRERSSADVTIEFVSALRNMVSRHDDYRAALNLVPELPTDSLNIAILKLVSFFGAVVFFGGNGELEPAIKWRKMAGSALEDIAQCRGLAEFEYLLLLSRFWRAACYCPFLTKDKPTLLFESYRALDLANSLSRLAKTSYEQYLAQENLVAALETHSRICTECGNESAALDAILRACNEIDPEDVKTLLQVSRMFAERGDPSTSLQYAFKAAYIGIPLAHLAWYEAGEACVRMNDLSSARHCYVLSLAFRPGGLSPVERLNMLQVDKNILEVEKESISNLLASIRGVA